jgi:HD-like signal output (HDOD) protein
MVAAAILIALLACLGCVAYWRTQAQAAATAAASPNIPVSVRPPAAAPTVRFPDHAQLEAVSGTVAERLWRLAFGASSQLQAIAPEHARVRDAIVAVLRADTLDPQYFPRRPTLMPQLMRAVNDPNAAPDKVSRIIAQDPVLTADVLRLANSSFYRMTPAPVETIQRAVVICGVDGLQALMAAALLQPVFRATDSNFPRFPRLLWERTERTSRAAELYAMRTRREDRFEAQLIALLSALGPLVVYRAALDVYSRTPGIAPSPALCVALIGALGAQMSQRIAAHWETSPRLVAALAPGAEDALTTALHVGELLGTVSLLESQQAISPEESRGFAANAGLPEGLITHLRQRLGGDAAAAGTETAGRVPAAANG